MARKCYISFKREDVKYKVAIQEGLKDNIIDKSLDEAIDSTDEDYIMSRIREDYLSDSTVTIHLIGEFSAENLGWQQRYIKRELQASLYDSTDNPKNGILGVVLPSVYNKVYEGSGACSRCGTSILYVDVENTTVKEFSYNYHIPNNKCHWSEEDRYCVLVKWDDFVNNPDKYIEDAFAKRNQPISKKTNVYP